MTRQPVVHASPALGVVRMPVPPAVLADLLVHIGREYQECLGVLFEDYTAARRLSDGDNWMRREAGVSEATAIKQRDVAYDALVAALPVVWWEQTADEAHRHAADVDGAADALDHRTEQGRADAGYELAGAIDAQEALVAP